jgi:type II secretory ATPase GspE/PulE/Tfp pilus assembly ATPase PilB-like protein
MAEYYKLPYADLNTNIPTKDQILKIPRKTAEKHRLIFFKDADKTVTVATDSPKGKSSKSAVKKIFPKKNIKLAYSLPEDIDSLLLYYRDELKDRFKKILAQKDRAAPEILEEIFKDAVIFRASDIHFEPRENDVVIRFRIDGAMQEIGKLPRESYENILNLIKIRSRLRTDEHFAAQDGSMRHKKDDNIIDLRVSIVPAIDGEKVVIRLLAQYVRSFTLEDIGFCKDHQEKMLEASRSPFGMILVTGPTGSGKTTTLYSVLKTLNRPEVNIATIEDPVEYKITGVNHIQVNPKTDLTFAKGLRSIVRQDPDIILVGEIRDQETVEISVNAALTGHLLLSTFHSNDAATAIPRLLDMGAEHFLLASTLELVVAQRLVRNICEKCRYSYTESLSKLKEDIPDIKKHFKNKSKITLYKGKGCNNCNHTGYQGRTSIFEMIEITKEMKELILENPSSAQIWELARKQGARSMFEDGIKKVKEGKTTLEEVRRVAHHSS